MNTNNDGPTQDFDAIGTKGASDLGNNTTISGSTGGGMSGNQASNAENAGYGSSGTGPSSGDIGPDAGARNQAAGGAMQPGGVGDQSGSMGAQSGVGAGSVNMGNGAKSDDLRDEDVQFESDMGEGASAAAGSAI